MLKFYFRSALRVLRRNKWITLINIIGLSVGLAVFIVIFLFVKDELESDRYHENISRIARLETDEFVDMPMVAKSMIGDEFPGIEKVVRLSYLVNQAYLWNGKNTIKVTDLLLADREVFNVFSFEFISGNPATALNDAKSIILTESTSRKFFGKENPVGRSLRYNNKFELYITGVIKDLPENSSIWAGIIGNIELLGELKGKEYLKDYNQWSHYTFVLLHPEASMQETALKINRKLNDEIHKMMNAWYFTIKFKLTPMSDLYFRKGPASDSFNHGSYQTIMIYSAIAVFILLIAIVNFVNLSNAAAFRRSREIGLKKLAGAEPHELIVQLLTESVILSVVALVFALFLFELIYPVFNALTSASVSPSDLYTPLGISFCILIAIITGLLSGLWPALFLTRFKPVNVLKGTFSSTRTGIISRRMLLIFQFFISVVLIVVALVIYQQMRYARTIELGFNKNQIVYFPVNENINNHRDAFIAAITEIPGMQEAGFTSSMPGYVNMNWGPRVDGIFRRFDAICCDKGFVDVLGLQVIEGRGFFDQSEAEYGKSYIVNETFVKNFDLEPALGKTILQGRIVGVVKDFSYKPVNVPIGPLAIVCSKDFTSLVATRISPIKMENTVASIEKVWNRFAAGFPFEYSFLDEAFDKLYKKEERLSELFGYFSLLAIIIACMGIAGLSINTLRIKAREISIRRVFGASSAVLTVKLLWEFTRWLILASVLAWPIAWYVTNEWLSTFAYHISVSWWIFLIATLAATLVVISVVMYNTIQSVKRNPVNALSWE